jgi:hypothetical protein
MSHPVLTETERNIIADAAEPIGLEHRAAFFEAGAAPGAW